MTADPFFQATHVIPHWRTRSVCASEESSRRMPGDDSWQSPLAVHRAALGE